MSRLSTTLKLPLVILFSFLFHAPSASASASASTAIDVRAFLIQSCSNVTIHQPVCVESLKPYMWYITKNPTYRQLAKLALAVSLKNTKDTQRLVIQSLNSLVKAQSKNNNDSSKYLEDCADQVGSSVDSLNGSLSELRNSGSNSSADYMMHLSNVQTWVSAALTNVQDCNDGMSYPYIVMRNAIKSSATYTAQLISNALAFCNMLVPN